MNQKSTYTFPFDPEAVCACGKKHRAAVGPCIVESGAINRVPELVKSFGATKVFVMADVNTYPVGGAKVVELLEASGIPTSRYVFPNKRLEPNEEAMGSLFLHFDHTCDMIVAFGSGVLNDLGKLLSFHTGKPYMIVASAPSMDGYASSSASMARAGVKVSLPCKCPDVIVGDLDILKNAPMELLKSGLGDMLAKYVSLVEWRIAHLLVDEYFCDAIAALMKDCLKECTDNASGLLRRDTAAVKAVFYGLVKAGMAMSYAESSRPASGTEHYYSHVWDMRGLEFGTPIGLHGDQASIGTFYTVKGYEKLKKIVPDREKALAYAKNFDFAAWSEEMTDFLGKGAESMIALEAKEKKYDVEKHVARLERILSHWEEILQIVEEELPSPAEYEAILDSIEAPKSVEDIGLSKDILPMTLKCTKDIRDKYILTRLLWDLGVLDEVAAMIE